MNAKQWPPSRRRLHFGVRWQRKRQRPATPLWAMYENFPCVKAATPLRAIVLRSAAAFQGAARAFDATLSHARRAALPVLPVAGVSLLLSAHAAPAVRTAPATLAPARPNVLWITSEDNSPLLGCYGDSLATTPRLDRLAREGVVFEKAFATTPVCAPARFALLTGVTAGMMGTEPMRSRHAIPAFVRPYPDILREAGYYCTNPGKTDYNYATNDKSHWNKGDYNNRAPGQPFFHVVNLNSTHESQVHNRTGAPRHDPARVVLPPYHPDTSEIRRDWAHYYDQIELMDSEAGKILDQLERDGLAGDTIVIYCSDHGGALTRGKRFLNETGTRVAMIVRVPEKFRHLAPAAPGGRVKRPVDFTDFAPTFLALAGCQQPAHMEGFPFLGEISAGADSYPKNRYIHLTRGRMDEVIDLMRGVRDERFRYIRNYMPHRIYGQHLAYMWKINTTRAWEKAFLEGKCDPPQSIFWNPKPAEELYDVQDDPWEVRNLAGDPRYAADLHRLRAANDLWVREHCDAGFLPESQLKALSENGTPYEAVRARGFPIERVIETAEIASWRDAKNLPLLIGRLGDAEQAVRYWAATGCVALGRDAQPASAALESCLGDACPEVRIAAAEALCLVGKYAAAKTLLMREVATGDESARYASGAIEALKRAGVDFPESSDLAGNAGRKKKKK